MAGWILLYRHGARRRELSIGRYPGISLADARSIAIIKRAEIMQGRNPAADKRKAKSTAAKSWSVRELVNGYTLGRFLMRGRPRMEVDSWLATPDVPAVGRAMLRRVK